MENKQGIRVIQGTFKNEFIGHVVANAAELERRIEKQSRKAARVAAKTFRNACKAGEARALHHTKVMQHRAAERLHYEATQQSAPTTAQSAPTKPELKS